MPKLAEILHQIDTGTMVLPEFQRGYVWNRDQVRGLMRSVYREYPVGTLLIWESDARGFAVRGGNGSGGPKQLLLDGQQRITTLYGVIRGRAPSFFEGDPSTFAGLRFHIDDEVFEFYTPAKMTDDPRWIDVTAFYQNPEAQYEKLSTIPNARMGEYLRRLSQLSNVLQREFHAERITGADKTVDVVVDIFNRVNSGGTKLSKGDLALARICAEWTDARPAMRRTLQGWGERGFTFTPDWLLRNVNAVATGRAPFAALEGVRAGEFERALAAATAHIGHFLGLVSGRLGLDHDRVLMGRYAFPIITRLLELRGGSFANGLEADRALFWYVHSALRGRFAGSTETMLEKDLDTVQRSGIDGLIIALQRARGGVTVTTQDFEGNGRGSRIYPLLYLLSRVQDAHDLVTGASLSQGEPVLGVHQVFPKTLLYRHGYPRGEVNAVANYAFLSASSGERLANRDPAEYLRECDPDALRSQWIPADPELWAVPRYRDFLAARRKLLATAANTYLDELATGKAPWATPLKPVEVSAGADERDARAVQLEALIEELTGMGFAAPAVDAEIPDPDTGRVLAVAEAYWADGLQVGQGAPVVLELDPEEADLPRLAELGCEVFTSVDALRGYVQRRNELAAGNAPLEPEPAGLAPVEELAEQDEAAAVEVRGFEQAVLHLVDRCRTELRYNPKYFRAMINKYGGLGAVRRLLAAPAVSDSFVKLWEKQRLDLTAEALAVHGRWAHLFTAKELEIARDRLSSFGYGPAAEAG